MVGLPAGMIMVSLAPWLAVLGGAFYLGLRVVRAIERRTAARAEIAELTERTLRLDENLSAMGERLDRLAEGQDFTARLLAERK